MNAAERPAHRIHHLCQPVEYAGAGLMLICWFVYRNNSIYVASAGATAQRRLHILHLAPTIAYCLQLWRRSNDDDGSRYPRLVCRSCRCANNKKQNSAFCESFCGYARYILAAARAISHIAHEQAHTWRYAINFSAFDSLLAQHLNF